MILAFKLLIAPFLIGFVTLAGRRWGSIVSGLLIGAPLTSGPISFILAYEHGLQFAGQAAIGSLAGQISMCIFCLTYVRVARKHDWPISCLASSAAFLLATLAWNQVSWQLLPALGVLLVVMALVAPRIAHQALTQEVLPTPKWDLPARIATATAFVVLLTTAANELGPQLSGLLSPFPVFGIVFAAFTHARQGTPAASSLLRGIVLGSGAYAAFFLIVGLLIARLGIAPTYLLATCAALSASAAFYFVSRQATRQHCD